MTNQCLYLDDLHEFFDLTGMVATVLHGGAVIMAKALDGGLFFWTAQKLPDLYCIFGGAAL